MQHAACGGLGPKGVIAANGLRCGATGGGGAYGAGTMFERQPPSGPASGADGAWTETVLYGFTGQNGDGAYPGAGLAIDAHGALYGPAYGGGLGDNGTVFVLQPPAGAGGAWVETVLYGFTGQIGGFAPLGQLALGKDGTIFGATTAGGYGAGLVFRLPPPPPSEPMGVTLGDDGTLNGTSMLVGAIGSPDNSDAVPKTRRSERVRYPLAVHGARISTVGK